MWRGIVKLWTAFSTQALSLLVVAVRQFNAYTEILKYQGSLLGLQ
jgi:hypothetical protein